jgi:hypothetical protein
MITSATPSLVRTSMPIAVSSPVRFLAVAVPRRTGRVPPG